MTTDQRFSERAQKTSSLEERRSINQQYSSADFDQWLLGRLEIRLGENVLDVGCGSGAQTIPMAVSVGHSGTVSALDISESSISTLQAKSGSIKNIEAHCADMMDLREVIARKFKIKKYDLVHSSYALYYAKDPSFVLNTMVDALEPDGRCIIFCPHSPHGLVKLAQRFTSVPKAVTDSLEFGVEVVVPYLRRNLKRVLIHHFDNRVTVDDSETLLNFYRATTYYDQAAEPAIKKLVDDQIQKHGNFSYEKHGILIAGYKA